MCCLSGGGYGADGYGGGSGYGGGGAGGGWGQGGGAYGNGYGAGMYSSFTDSLVRLSYCVSFMGVGPVLYVVLSSSVEATCLPGHSGI